jgi:hypothetical protein
MPPCSINPKTKCRNNVRRSELAVHRPSKLNGESRSFIPENRKNDLDFFFFFKPSFDFHKTSSQLYAPLKNEKASMHHQHLKYSTYFDCGLRR